MAGSPLSFPLEQFEVYFLIALLSAVTGWGSNHLLVIGITNQDVVIILLAELVLTILVVVVGIYGGIDRGYLFHLLTGISGRFPGGLFTNYLTKVVEGFVAILPVVFQIILAINLLALIPATYCFTAQFSVTGFLSALTFFGAVAISLLWGGKHFALHFIPGGVPAPLKPPLTVIELVSYISRLFSLAIRLFANLVAGHSLLHILGGSTVGIGRGLAEKDVALVLVALIPAAITTAVYGLESGIAGLQAYVFLVLSLIYLREGEQFIG